MIRFICDRIQAVFQVYFIMLYLVTLPPELHPGTYVCTKLTHDEAGKLIKEASEASKLRSFVNFASTKFAIRDLCGVKVDVLQKVELPVPSDGESFISCRVKDKAAEGRIGLEQLEFFRIEFSGAS